MQNTLIAVQAVLPKRDIPIGTAIIMFSQTLGGALFISVAQNVFSNRLLIDVSKVVPDLNPEVVISAGATNLKTAIATGDYANVLIAYNLALQSTYYVAVALSALSIFGAVFIEWKSVKGKKMDVAAA